MAVIDAGFVVIDAGPAVELLPREVAGAGSLALAEESAAGVVAALVGVVESEISRMGRGLAIAKARWERSVMRSFMVKSR